MASETYFEKICAVPKMVSSWRGKEEVSRHLMFGADWAIAADLGQRLAVARAERRVDHVLHADAGRKRDGRAAAGPRRHAQRATVGVVADREDQAVPGCL